MRTGQTSPHWSYVWFINRRWIGHCIDTWCINCHVGVYGGWTSLFRTSDIATCEKKWIGRPQPCTVWGRRWRTAWTGGPITQLSKRPHPDQSRSTALPFPDHCPIVALSVRRGGWGESSPVEFAVSGLRGPRQRRDSTWADGQSDVQQVADNVGRIGLYSS